MAAEAMRRVVRVGFGLGALALLAGGCQNKLQDENLQFHEQNRALQAELSEARAKLAAAEGRATDAETRLQSAPNPAQVTTLEARVHELEDQLKQSQAAVPAAADPTTPGVAAGHPAPSLGAGIEAKYDRARGTLTVNLPGEVLFDKGKADLKPTAAPTLDKIAAALKKDYAAKTIYVDGHTDASPVTKTKNQWDDNWDLGAVRANAVRKYLVSKGVDSRHLNLRSFGPNKPKGNENASRRVEIVVQVN